MESSPDEEGTRSLPGWIRSPRASFREWRRPRPVLGSLLLIAGGLVIGYVPLQFTAQLLLIGGTFTMIGAFFATLVVFTGLGALFKPRYASIFGAFGLAFSTLSLFGALGGLLVGMLISTVGGVLCYAWEPPADLGMDVKTLAEASEFIWQGTGGFIWGESGRFIWQTDDSAETTDVELSVEDVELPAEDDEEIETGDLDDRFKL